VIRELSFVSGAQLRPRDLLEVGGDPPAGEPLRLQVSAAAACCVCLSRRSFINLVAVSICRPSGGFGTPERTEPNQELDTAILECKRTQQEGAWAPAGTKKVTGVLETRTVCPLSS